MKNPCRSWCSNVWRVEDSSPDTQESSPLKERKKVAWDEKGSCKGSRVCGFHCWTYDTMLPRMETIMEHLNQFPLDQLPPDAERLFHMSLSLIEVSMAVELFKQPGVIHGFDVSRFVPIE